MAVELNSIDVNAGTRGTGRLAEPKRRATGKRALFEGTSLCVLMVLSFLCLALGIAIFVVPAGWVSSGLVIRPGADAARVANATCPDITPDTTPYAPTIHNLDSDGYCQLYDRALL